jgi:hypothetical protein
MKVKTTSLVTLAALMLLFYPTMAAPCSIDVYGLRATSGGVQAEISNNGEWNATVSYKLKIDLVTAAEGGMNLTSGNTYDFSHNHAFGEGDFEIWLEVNSTGVNGNQTCHASDFMNVYFSNLEPVRRCILPEGLEGDTRCDYIARGLSYCDGSQWVPYSEYPFQYCDMCKHCGDGVCNCWEEQACPGDCEGIDYKPCGVEITEMDHPSNVEWNATSYVNARIRNTGMGVETITVKLFVDNVQSGTNQTGNLLSGDSRVAGFTFRPTPGKKVIRVDAQANCSSGFDTKSASIIVYNRSDNRTVPYPPEPDARTGINIYPASLDIEVYKSRTVTVNVESNRYQTVNISVSGINPSWVVYEPHITLERGHDGIYRKDGYVYITPQETGSYSMLVKALGQFANATENISIYAAPEQNLTETEEGPHEGVLPLVLIVALAIMAVIAAAYFGIKHLRMDEEDASA